MKLEKQIQLLEQITGKKVVLEEEHECHCGGSCCTDKAQLNEAVGDLANTLNTLIGDAANNWKSRSNLIERTQTIIENNPELDKWLRQNRGEFLRKLYHFPGDITTYRLANEMTKAMKGMGMVKEALNESAEDTIIDLGQMVDPKIYRAYINYKGDKAMLSSLIRNVRRVMKSVEIEDLPKSKAYKNLASALGLKVLNESLSIKEDAPGDVLNLVWEALSALEIVRRNVAKAKEFYPDSQNLEDASKWVDEAYRALKPLEENSSKNK